MEAGIRIDQALFGYREGHRLLQASRKFSTADERTLLILTDLSGPRTVEGFEEYVSGYPLDDGKLYAVVKTWYAPEMERPGCVWSHVLLIANSDLLLIKDISILNQLFYRPTTLEDEQYRSAVRLKDFSTPSADSQISSYPSQLLAALYGAEQKPLIIPGNDSYEFQAMVFGIWSQQWPALRQSFAFCTGSLSNRTIAGRSFDLQVAPFRLLRELQRDSNAFVVDVKSPAISTSGASDSWLSDAVEDLERSGGPLRNFLWRYAEGSAADRSLFGKLAGLYRAMQDFASSSESKNQKSLSGITRQIVSAYPSPMAGAVLKRDFFGYRVQESQFWGFVDEQTILTELATTTHYDGFDASQLQLRYRASDRWQLSRECAESLLFSLLDRRTTPFADEIIAGFIDAMSGDDVCQIASSKGGSLLALVVRNSRILKTTEFWKCSRNPDTYYGILDYLRNDEAAGVPRDWLLHAIDNGPAELATPIVSGFAADAVKAILRRVTSSDTDIDWVPSVAWRTALATQQSELISCLDQPETMSSVRAMTFLAGLLDSHDPTLKSFGLKPWLELARSGKDLVLTFPNAEAAAFLLSLGYTHKEKEAMDLIEACFEHVHAAAHSNALDPLSYRAWKALERDVPTLSARKNWDKCERLRLALLGAFLGNSWPPADVLRCVKRAGTWRDIYNSWVEARGGEEFLEKVAEAVYRGGPDVTPEKRNLFHSCFHRNYWGTLKLND